MSEVDSTAMAPMVDRRPHGLKMQAAMALLPGRDSLCGPVTQLRILRLALLYSDIFLIGIGIACASTSARWQAFAFGLMLPGGGFLAHAGFADMHGLMHLGAALCAAALFGAALIAWFATGNVLAPPLIWLIAALLAASMDHGAIRAGGIMLIASVQATVVAGTIILSLSSRRQGMAQRQTANAYLATAGCSMATQFRCQAGEPAPEFTPQELKLMRFLLDRALQPVPAFAGFEWLDQFQTAAVRYQVNFIGYALSMAQASRLPALHGYLDVAQQRLIEKMKDHRIWRYWALENLWGNLSAGRDPVSRDNIMYTGFCALQIAMYQAASGRHDYDLPGSLTLRHSSGQLFIHDFPSLIQALVREHGRSAFHLVACEPNWIYPLCNVIGAAAIRAADARTGDHRWATQEQLFRQHLEAEFIDLSGRFVPCRSAYTGLALPVIGGAMPQAMPCFFLNATMPDIALRQWLLLRRSLLERGRRGTALRRGQFWRVDTGNYRFARAAAFAGTALAAAEMGDREISELCLFALEEECPGSEEQEIFYREQASVWAHAVEFFARSGGKDAFRNLITAPRRSATGPAISGIRYSEVLVARAVNSQDTLAAVLYPGTLPGRQVIRLSGLIPGCAYRCEGTHEQRVTADRQGEAAVHVDLGGRTEMRILRVW